jgi:predicted DNA-binding transcriptional regulator YafY
VKPPSCAWYDRPDRLDRLMSSAKTSRWLDLIAFLLRHRYPVTREDIFANVKGYQTEPPSPVGGRGQGVRVDGDGETLRRMFERDKDELRTLGIEIETVPIPDAKGDEPAQGYRLRPGAFYLPYLEFHERRERVAEPRPYQGLARLNVSPADLELLDRATQLVAQRTESPLAASAASARRKLEFDLPLPQTAVERVLAEEMGSDGARSLDLLQRAVADRVAVTSQYYSIGRNEKEQRSIEPYGLFFTWGRWYCVARARDRDALRVFRVDRMSDVAIEKGKQSAFEVPGDFSLHSYLNRAPWELSGRESTSVTVRFAFPESRWVQAQGVGVAVEPLLDDGGAILEFKVQDSNPFLRWLLTFRKQATIVAPEAMAQALAEMRRRVALLYA